MLKAAVLLKETIIQSSGEAGVVTSEPWQEGGSETAGSTFVVAIGDVEARYIL